ncbi:hypothetical protein [Streptomyces rapamycinicus]|uniref:Uncharacterized protein n=2 Tax=Streptomyces rapamycinicus TaxID=1226757 RepID=A0A0A0NNE3_STRRN|nr:hypothetical protein [Streptomyces rapamycinicus]AGP57643.1 hypothetical protein M271_31055 [Streptomyces rapamycinicus NRRL 5491]MBB4785306.1 hypothetical protein [Streptomyces rapamycinicus]RLV79224.1 hypothetical protein D3C57_112605 [Streptomyces rapamycinicus NRRL 5491]UTO65505.1 hypothetical protein LJB45_26405 [Streptomyces rapamycinicus]UTP33463.1 hypothetical protein LIV37_31535 [Streptomyces rapamycinicus NRRL 5491]
MNAPPPPAHWHCYRWTGERRTYDDESARRPPYLVVQDISAQERKQIAAASPAFMASDVPPLEVPQHRGSGPPARGPPGPGVTPALNGPRSRGRIVRAWVGLAVLVGLTVPTRRGIARRRV